MYRIVSILSESLVSNLLAFFWPLPNRHSITIARSEDRPSRPQYATSRALACDHNAVLGTPLLADFVLPDGPARRQKLGYTDDVVDLMVGKLKQLPDTAQPARGRRLSNIILSILAD